ncbi:hypothetical protein [Nocardia spumae]|uniref:hypothetical protein n=1 Tax=Nocardia spumae TaxID=2887190 RepID=UPI001D137016|nr:hypothetical protein [Nocardia spumae]
MNNANPAGPDDPDFDGEGDPRVPDERPTTWAEFAADAATPGGSANGPVVMGPGMFLDNGDAVTGPIDFTAHRLSNE